MPKRDITDVAYLGSAALLKRFMNTLRTHHEKELVQGYSGSKEGGSILHFITKAFTDVACLGTGAHYNVQRQAENSFMQNKQKP